MAKRQKRATAKSAAETAARRVRNAIAATVTAAEHVAARAARAITTSKAPQQKKRRATRTRTESTAR